MSRRGIFRFIDVIVANDLPDNVNKETNGRRFDINKVEVKVKNNEPPKQVTVKRDKNENALKFHHVLADGIEHIECAVDFGKKTRCKSNNF